MQSGREPAYQALDPSTSHDEVQRFIDTQVLDKPLTFAKTDAFTRYFSCAAWGVALASYGVACLCPIALFQPKRVTDHYELRLDQDTLTFDSARNDCCWHIARSKKTVPLDKVQDVQLQEGCCETCFGLKKIEVQTAGMNGPNGSPEIVATFLQDPEQAREAIQLGVKLSRARMLAPQQQAMTTMSAAVPQYHGHAGSSAAAAPGVPAKTAPGTGMQDRLQRLTQLVELGVLSTAEADKVRARVLAASKDFSLSLVEAHELKQQGLINDKDFKAVRDELLAQVNSRQN